MTVCSYLPYVLSSHRSCPLDYFHKCASLTSRATVLTLIISAVQVQLLEG